MRTKHSITVPVPKALVFDYLSDVSNETQWRQSIVGSRYVNAAKPQIGVDGETDVAMGSKSLTMKWTVVEFVDGAHVAWELDGDPWHGGGSYSVAPSGDGTAIVAALEVRLQGLARLLEPLVWLQFRRGLHADLRSLERVILSVR